METAETPKFLQTETINLSNSKREKKPTNSKNTKVTERRVCSCSYAKTTTQRNCTHKKEETKGKNGEHIFF